MRLLPNAHPGEVLLREFLAPPRLSQSALARQLGLQRGVVNRIVLGRRRLTAQIAIRLARKFRTSEQFWMSLQAEHDLEQARRGAGQHRR